MVIKFDYMKQKAKASSSIFSTLLMVQPVQDYQEDERGRLDHKSKTRPPVYSFDVSGNPIYQFKDPVTRHCYWDLDCQYTLCTTHSDEEDDYPSAKRKRSEILSTRDT